MRVLVLGSGFLGSALARLSPEAVHTSRNPERQPSDRRWLRFDTADLASWASLEDLRVGGVVVALPLGSGLDLGALWHRLAAVSSRILLVGTTSAFGEAATVTDRTAIDPDNPRAAAEEALRTRGAAVIHAAGIYGPGRNPLDWLRRGRIDNAGKLVNLIHVDDLARACLFLLDNFEAGLRVVCSDGTPRAWRDIVAAAVAHGWIDEPNLTDREDPRSKRVLPRRLASRGFRLEHPDLFAELAALESPG